MPLLPFSIAEHVPLLLSGAKVRTTRQPRKNPLKVGDILHCYYKPRQKKTCGNCIVPNCKTYFENLRLGLKVSTCSEHRNFFGKARIIDIQHHYPTWPDNHRDLVIGGYYALFGNMPEEALEKWARADGFENFAEADKWFKKSTKNDKWMFLPLDVIIFEPEWVKKW